MNDVPPSNPVEDLAEVRRKMKALLAFAQRVALVGDDINNTGDAASVLWALVREARRLVRT